jgi:hypothetical protein
MSGYEVATSPAAPPGRVIALDAPEARDHRVRDQRHTATGLVTSSEHNEAARPRGAPRRRLRA